MSEPINFPLGAIQIPDHTDPGNKQSVYLKSSDTKGPYLYFYSRSVCFIS